MHGDIGNNNNYYTYYHRDIGIITITQLVPTETLAQLVPTTPISLWRHWYNNNNTIIVLFINNGLQS